VPQVIEALAVLEQQPWAVETSVFGVSIHVSVLDERAAKREIPKVLSARGIRVDSLERITPSLEDVFIFLLDQETSRAA